MADLDAEKANAAAHAVNDVQDGMLVGLGSGRTSAYAVRFLARRIAAGLRITGTATSRTTGMLAESLGIPLEPFERVTRVDLTIDGADEITAELHAIKGGGGALLREKVVAAASDRMIVIADSGKLVPRLGRFPLAVEVLPFACASVMRRLEVFGVPVIRRMTSGGPFVTDQGGYILDIAFGSIPEPEAIAATLDAIPGLLEHGLFLSEIDMAVIGRGDSVEIIRRP